ncbi:MAG: hypothetical protein NTW62_00090 [Candidatus Nomurabacteria bacterium]|nr:hypothetical protein [Candidatus Nomurabacteria bacterium]
MDKKKYWFFGSKLNTILLFILIVLSVFAIKIMLRNEAMYLPILVKDIKEDKISIPAKIISIPKPDTTAPASITQTVKIGEEFTIKKGEKVSVSDAYRGDFTLTNFYYHPCPPNAACIWSGLDIFYQIHFPEIKNISGVVQQQEQFFLKDKPLQNMTDTPYRVTIKDSDYKTYAKIVLYNTDQSLVD